MAGGLRRGGLRRPVMAAVALTLAATMAACTNDDEPEPEPTASTPSKKIELTLGVYGSDPEISAYESAVRSFNATSATTHATVKSWPSHDAAVRDLRPEDADRPDIFMASRRDLPWMSDDGANMPVDELLDSRGVTFSDDYSRDALEAFSADSQLQCMPYSISPMVIYYNTDLVDFDTMAERDLPVPSRRDVWSFETFTAAADFADRGGKGIGGVYIEPTLSGLAPFIFSGGGQLFDDEVDPTTLAFSSDNTQAALEETLTVLRDPAATLSPEQLNQATGLTWFKRGKLGMMAGLRDLVPQLRAVDGLKFDVMPMPVLDDYATVGDVTGLCMAKDTEDKQAAADLLEHLSSEEQVDKVARTGYIVPARLSVATSDAFLQPTEDPQNAAVFHSSLRRIVNTPLLENESQLAEVIEPYLQDMLTDPVLDLPGLGESIDEASAEVLNPPDDETSSPEDSDSESPTP